MFSNRINLIQSTNPISQILEDKRKNGEKILDLTQSNPTCIGLDYSRQHILEALSRKEVLKYEPDPCGLVQARTAIAEYYRALGHNIAPTSVYLTASTSEAYASLFKILGNPGDQILIPSPGYPLLSYLAQFESLEPVLYPHRYAQEIGWYLDLDSIEARITNKTCAIVMVNPNNPTGVYLKNNELLALEQICSLHNLALIVDEVFSDYYTEKTPQIVRTVAGDRKALTFVLNGFSKMLALPQVKLGWIVVNGGSQQVEAAKKRLEILLDFYLSVSAQVQHAVRELMELKNHIQSQLQKRIQLNQQQLNMQLAKTANCHMLKREGGWYAVIEIDDQIEDEKRVLELLTHTNTYVHPGYFYEFHRDGFLVLSLLPTCENFRIGIANIVQRFGCCRK